MPRPTAAYVPFDWHSYIITTPAARQNEIMSSVMHDTYSYSCSWHCNYWNYHRTKLVKIQMLLMWITAANEFSLNKLTTEAGIFIISVGYSQKRTNSHDLHLTSRVTVLSESSARLIERNTSWFSGVPCACIRYEISVAWKTGGGRNTKNGSEQDEEERGKKNEVKGRKKQIKQWMKDSEK